MQEFDVIVLGGGAGGLSAAAILARANRRVLLLERLPFVGGRFSSLTHEDYIFTTGAVSIEGGGSLETLFQELEIPFHIKYPEPQVAYRIGHRDLVLPDKGALSFLLREISSTPKDVRRVIEGLKGISSEEAKGLSVSSWLAQHTRDPGIYGIFRSLCGGVFSVSLEEAPMNEFLNMVEARSFRRYGFPPEGNSKLVEELARVVESAGGILRKRAAATSIKTLEGRVVEVAWKEDVKTRVAICSDVVSNLGVRKTAALIGEKDFPEDERIRMARSKPAYTMTLEILSDRPFFDFPGILMLPLAERAAFMTCPTLICPELASTGRHMTTVLGPPSRSEEPFDGRAEIGALLRDAEDHLHGFNRNKDRWIIRVFRKEWPGFRARPGSDLDQKSSIGNLFYVGDGVKPSGVYGVGACVESARIVVGKILNGRIRIQPPQV